MTTPETSPTTPDERPPIIAASNSSASASAVPSSDAVNGHPSTEQHAAALTLALNTLAEQMSQIEWGAEHLSCSETEAIADVLILTGHVDAAKSLREFHSYGDDDPGDQHHARYHDIHDHDDYRRMKCCGPDTSDQLTDRIKEER